MKLYRIDLIEPSDIVNRNFKSKLFEPRIPPVESRICNYNNELNEDSSIPRICFSESIKGCLSAIGVIKLHEYFSQNTKFISDEYEGENVTKVIDIGMPFFLFEVETEQLDRNNLRSYEDLYKNTLAPDAGITKEYWYTNPIELNGIKCVLNSITYQYEDILPYRLKNRKNISDREFGDNSLSIPVVKQAEYRICTI